MTRLDPQRAERLGCRSAGAEAVGLVALPVGEKPPRGLGGKTVELAQLQNAEKRGAANLKLSKNDTANCWRCGTAKLRWPRWCGRRYGAAETTFAANY